MTRNGKIVENHKKKQSIKPPHHSHSWKTQGGFYHLKQTHLLFRHIALGRLGCY